MVLIAISAGGVGVFAGTRLKTTPGSATAPAMAPTAEGTATMPGMEMGAPPPPAGAGTKAVFISAARQQLIGVRTGVVEHQRALGTVRTVGTLAYDETRVAQIHTKVSGWVEQLFVDYVGKPVKRGQPLFSVYSPDLVTAQADYLIALRGEKQAGAGDKVFPEAKAGADALLVASRDRLRRWDISDAQIANLEHTLSPSRTLTLASPFDGVVLDKSAFAGQYVTPDMASFKLADLSSIWVVGQAFEYEASRFRPGDALDIEFPYGQAEKLTAKIDFIYPEVDPQTRRIRFRATLQNKDRTLKPDTYVTLVWRGEAIDRLMTPKESVIDTGERTYVLLALANGYFEPRDVKLGPPVGEFYPVVSGLTAGEHVVTSAQFLVDSETNLMAAMKSMSMSMSGMDMGKESDKAAAKPEVPAPAAPRPPVPDAISGVPKAPRAPEMPPMPGMPGMNMPASSAPAPPPATHHHPEP